MIDAADNGLESGASYPRVASKPLRLSPKDIPVTRLAAGVMLINNIRARATKAVRL